jgi:hypothetical protein
MEKLEPGIDAQLSPTLCPSCQSDLILSSRPRGALQEVGVIIGGNLCRCQNCEARHIFLGPFAFRLSEHYHGNDGVNFGLVGTAIVGGITICLMVAFLILRRFHRFPF